MAKSPFSVTSARGWGLSHLLVYLIPCVWHYLHSYVEYVTLTLNLTGGHEYSQLAKLLPPIVVLFILISLIFIAGNPQGLLLLLSHHHGRSTYHEKSGFSILSAHLNGRPTYHEKSGCSILSAHFNGTYLAMIHKRNKWSYPECQEKST